MKKYYVGLDAHKATLAIAVLDPSGKIISQSIIETSTQAVRDYFHSLRGEVHLTFEEGNHASWLYDVVQPLVKRVIVCNPKHNRRLMGGSKSDRIDARRLAELLRLNAVREVYHGEKGTRTLKHLMRCYECLVKDITRVQNRLTSLYNSAAIKYRRGELYHLSKRRVWIERLEDAGQRTRAELFFRQMDQLKALKRAAKKAMIAEGLRHPAHSILSQVPELGEVRVAREHSPQ